MNCRIPHRVNEHESDLRGYIYFCRPALAFAHFVLICAV